MKLTSFIAFFCISTVTIGVSQPTLTVEEQNDKKYEKRIKKEYLHGVYIPKDLTDAFEQLNKLIDKESKKKFKEVPESIAVRKLHFSLGRWMIYNWGFYEGSRLSHSIKRMGVYHPDDMANFIIITYHRYLNKNKLEMKALIEQFKEKQEKEKAARKSRGTVIHQEKKKREKPPEGQ